MEVTDIVSVHVGELVQNYSVKTANKFLKSPTLHHSF